ncbi:MAG: ParB/RepB/Spo0J family partition protein [Candidatus Buchananbacteria bacterium]|jgi:ParB/RepB/Spo0J family partition protein
MTHQTDRKRQIESNQHARTDQREAKKQEAAQRRHQHQPVQRQPREETSATGPPASAGCKTKLVYESQERSKPPAVTPPATAKPVKPVTNNKWGEITPSQQADQIAVGTVILVDPRRVSGDPTQPRRSFNKEELNALADSITQDGQEEPAHVFRFRGDPSFDWMLTSGERRKKACEARGLPLMVLVKEKPNSDLMRLICEVVTNENRVGLVPIEKAWAIRRLLDSNKSVEEIGRYFGNKSSVWVYQMLELLKLVPQVQSLMTSEIPDRERLGPGVAREIAKLPPINQLRFAQRVLKDRLTIQAVTRYVRDAIGKADAKGTEEENLLTGLGSAARPRVPSDDRKVLDAFLRRVATLAAQYEELACEQFTLMYEPRTDRDHAVSVFQAERIISNMTVVLAKLRLAKVNPRLTPTSVEEPKSPANDGLVPAMTALVAAATNNHQGIAALFSGQDREDLLAALETAQQVGMVSARVRRTLKTLLSELGVKVEV